MRRLGLGRLARVGILGLPWLGLACAQVPTVQRTPPGPMQLLPNSSVDPAMTTKITPPPWANAETFRASDATTQGQKQTLPISLDTVLRLAEEQNPTIGVARTKVNAAFIEQEAAASRWLPDIYVGWGYFRHQGGIQLQEGPLVRSSTGALAGALQINAEYNPRDLAFRQVDAARKLWQNQGDLSKITYEQMLEASTTYVDLLSAHAALVISQDLVEKLKPVLEKATKAWEMNDKTADFEVEKSRIDADIKTQQQLQQKLSGQIKAASAKLTYLLGLDPNLELVPVDAQMAAFHLVDANLPTETLVSTALSNGPGVRELESIIGVIHEGLESAQGTKRFLPVMSFQMGEGLFAAGPGGTLDWSNRYDMALQARWNISEVFNAKRKKQVVYAQINQVTMTAHDLKAKLTLGVHEAKQTSEAASEQFKSSEVLIESAKTILKLSEKMHEANPMSVPFSSLGMAHKAVAQAQLNYVDIMREYDKAQLRLLALTSPTSSGGR